MSARDGGRNQVVDRARRARRGRGRRGTRSAAARARSSTIRSGRASRASAAVEPVAARPRAAWRRRARACSRITSGSFHVGKSANSSPPTTIRTSPKRSLAQRAVSTVYEGRPRRARAATSSTPGSPRTPPRPGGSASRRRSRPPCAAPRRRRDERAARARAPRSPGGRAQRARGAAGRTCRRAARVPAALTGPRSNDLARRPSTVVAARFAPARAQRLLAARPRRAPPRPGP